MSEWNVWRRGMNEKKFHVKEDVSAARKTKG
jgi:hypothetical protein